MDSGADLPAVQEVALVADPVVVLAADPAAVSAVATDLLTAAVCTTLPIPRIFTDLITPAGTPVPGIMAAETAVV